MKFKVLFLLTLVSMLSFQSYAQGRGVRIGYIDTEYILQNVPEYSEATSQLETKVQKWKKDIEKQLKGIAQKRTNLNNEKALLTKELIEEREEDIFFEEKEILDYQQKRFGPNGDLMIQKRQLMQPVQDQIFQAVQDIAKAKKYDFIFDKSADVVMLYSAERFDISEQVLRTITRSSNRKQLKSKKEKKQAKEEDVTVEIDGSKDARQLALDKKKADRAALVEARKKVVADKRAAAIAAREKLKQEKLEARNKLKEGTEEKVSDEGTTQEQTNKEESTAEKTSTAGKAGDKKAETEDVPKTKEEILEARKQKKLADRAARKKILDDKRKKTLEDRKKAKEEKEKEKEKESAPIEENQDD
ncbi:OmpH family outer membrane protein [Lacinutrix jangbogonensis]|uniref:OmpH family outer membrane protein n=1 Tax=Lacinutrix jangbogonensis TaxID=1469557 RepID=UPI00053F2178|nr:OmpH family outer membrane protein [Lacinutrix jangbogonensis]